MNKVLAALNADQGLVKVKNEQHYFIAKVVFMGEHEGREVVAVKDKNGHYHRIYIATSIVAEHEIMVDFVPTSSVNVDYNESRLNAFMPPVAPANTELLVNNNAVVARTPLQFA